MGILSYRKFHVNKRLQTKKRQFVDTFGLTSNPGSTIKELDIDTGKEIKSLTVSTSQIVYATVEGDVYEIGLKRTHIGCIQCNSPKKIKGLEDIKKVVSGSFHFLAMDGAGHIYGWGSNIYGESDPSSDEDYIYYPTEIPCLRSASDITASYSTSGCI